MSSLADPSPKRPRRARQLSRVAKFAVAAAAYGAVLGSWSLVHGQSMRHDVAVLPDGGGAQGACAVWFLGSSSINRWSTLGGDMKPWVAHNRGVDGATIRELTARFVHQPPETRPRAIVFYGGDNDIAFGESALEAIDDLRLFLAATARRLGDVPVFVLSVKPSPARWNLLAEQTAFNRGAQSLAARSPTLTFVDITRRMLSAGRPGQYYVADGIHMNAAGYRIWSEAIDRALRGSLPDKVVRACTRTRGGHERFKQTNG